jgi:hypothetical protein
MHLAERGGCSDENWMIHCGKLCGLFCEISFAVIDLMTALFLESLWSIIGRGILADFERMII